MGVEPPNAQGWWVLNGHYFQLAYSSYIRNKQRVRVGHRIQIEAVAPLLILLDLYESLVHIQSAHETIIILGSFVDYIELTLEWLWCFEHVVQSLLNTCFFDTCSWSCI